MIVLIRLCMRVYAQKIENEQKLHIDNRTKRHNRPMLTENYIRPMAPTLQCGITIMNTHITNTDAKKYWSTPMNLECM